MDNFFNNVFIEPFGKFLEKITGFLPNLLNSIALLLAGLVMAWILKTVIAKTAGFLKIDVLSERMGIMQVLQKSGIKGPLSGIIGKLIYWAVLAAFIIMGLEALKMSAVEELLSRFLLYLPNVVIAAVVIILGYLLGNFLGRAALIASVNAGLPVAGLLGKLVKFTVFIMASTMALELLGIGKETVLIAFAIVFGGAVLALSIAYGLGGRDAAKDHIEKMLKQKKDEDEIKHI